MRSKRQVWLAPVIVLAGAMAGALGCEENDSHVKSRPPSPASTAELLPAVDNAIAKGVRFLVERQSDDGAWRSDVYAPFKEGDALTPTVLAALSAVGPTQATSNALQKGQAYLQSLVGAEGTIEPPQYGVAYPVYTAAGVLVALAGKEDPKSAHARAAWLAYLRERQLTESNGWEPTDAFYGGWGYDAALPRKPADGVPVGPLTEPNLSATAFAVAALRAAGLTFGAPEFQKALHFVEGCQNYKPGEAQNEFDDGGFFFVQSDDVRNKAGIAGKDADGRERFVSYGSATADGLRTYLACGLSNDDQRVQAAWRWLNKNFSAGRHPGRYAPGRRAESDSVYFYYCQAMAELLAQARDEQIPVDIKNQHWEAKLAAALVARQNADGKWVNAEVEVRENDPVVATALALRALALYRRLIVVESSATPGASLHDDGQRTANASPYASG